jgi:hypothetical protein
VGQVGDDCVHGALTLGRTDFACYRLRATPRSAERVSLRPHTPPGLGTHVLRPVICAGSRRCVSQRGTRLCIFARLQPGEKLVQGRRKLHRFVLDCRQARPPRPGPRRTRAHQGCRPRRSAQHSSGIWGARVEQPKSGTPATASSARPTSTSRISSPAGWDKGCSERTGCRGLWSGSSAERPLAAPETRVPRNASRPTHVLRRTHVDRFDQAPRSAERGAFDPRQRPVPPPAPSWRLPARRGHLRSVGAGSCPRDVGDDRVELTCR